MAKFDATKAGLDALPASAVRFDIRSCASNVRRLRLEAGWSAAELARRSGLSSIMMIENGSVPLPRFCSLEAIASAFGLDVNDLFMVPREKPARRRPRRWRAAQ